MRKRGVATAILGLGIEAVNWFTPDWLASLAPAAKYKDAIGNIGIGLIIIGALLALYDLYDAGLLNPRRLWYRLKPFGVAINYDDFLNIGGDVNDLHLVMFIANVRASRRIVSISGYLENDMTGNRRAAFINWDGELRKPEEIRAIPPRSEFRIMVPFGEQQGRGIDQQAHPRVEDGLKIWGRFVFHLSVNGRTFRKSFSQRKILKQANAVMDEIRAQQIADHHRKSVVRS